MEKTTARYLALMVLDEIDEGRYSHLAAQSASLFSLQKRDREFALRCIYGVIERKMTLDYYLSLYTGKLQKTVRNILRMGLYQLLYMQVSDFAVVNESVLLAKRTRPYAAGMVNAVLRRYIREGKPTSLPRHRLDLAYSCPQWLIDRLQEEYGLPKTFAFLEDSLKAPPQYLRTNRMRITQDDLISSLSREGVEVQSHPHVPHCLKTISGNPLTTQAFQNGLFHVQDVSSQICACRAASFVRDSVLDLCAAPGGKCFTIYQECGAKVQYLACDKEKKRLSMVEEGCKRLGMPGVICKQHDATKPWKDSQTFSVVLCDLPCSGFGVIRRKPEIKYKTKQQIAPLPELQKAILHNASQYVRQKGVLLYSTCTLLPEENRCQTACFLKEHPDFTKIEEKTFFADALKGDGFYYALLERRGK